MWKQLVEAAVQASENTSTIAKNARGKKKGKKFAERKYVFEPADVTCCISCGIAFSSRLSHLLKALAKTLFYLQVKGVT